MNDKYIEKSGAMEAPASSPARAHNAGDGAAGAGPVGRFTAQRKLAVVQRLLRGEERNGEGVKEPGSLK